MVVRNGTITSRNFGTVVFKDTIWKVLSSFSSLTPGRRRAGPVPFLPRGGTSLPSSDSGSLDPQGLWCPFVPLSFPGTRLSLRPPLRTTQVRTRSRTDWRHTGLGLDLYVLYVCRCMMCVVYTWCVCIVYVCMVYVRCVYV